MAIERASGCVTALRGTRTVNPVGKSGADVVNVGVVGKLQHPLEGPIGSFRSIHVAMRALTVVFYLAANAQGAVRFDF